MASLEKRVRRQRDLLIASGIGVRIQAKRVHQRMRHPWIVVPGFLAGMFVGRGAALMLPLLPDLGDRLAQLKEEISTIDAVLKLMAALAPMLSRSLGTPPHRSYQGDVLR